MRAAVCRYIECLSIARIPLTVKQQVRLLDSVDENLRHPNEDIQKAAGFALAALTRSYFPVRESGPSERLQSRVVDKYIKLVNTSVNPAETRGYALALGSLPKKLLAPSAQVLDSVLTCLILAARFDATVGQQADAETRRNAIRALESVANEVGFTASSTPPAVSLCTHQLRQLCECFILGLQDYNTDRRGDIGSWSRIASMTGLQHLIFLAVDNNVEIELDVMTRIVGGLLKQLSEKLDNVRAHAGSCLEEILQRKCSDITGLSCHSDLCQSLQIGTETNWSDAKVSFRRVVKALDIPQYFHLIVSGLVVSVGALTESVTKEAEEALIGWLREKDVNGAKVGTRVEQIGLSFLQLFREHTRKGRVILPLMKTLEKLCNRGLMDVWLSLPDMNFASSLLGCLSAETRGCNDIHRLLSAVGVALGLLSQLNDMSLNCDVLMFVIGMLDHEFPRVRKHAADNLYVRLLEEPSVLPKQDNLDDVLDLLLMGQWLSDTVGDNNIDRLCVKVAQLIGVEFTPLLTRVAETKRVVGPPKDDFASYASLVNATLS